MSLKIDATSIHLGGDVPQYYAEYVPAIPEEQPPSCLLPPSVPLNLTNKPLVPLIPACNITFPDPVPLPPTYNPPPKYLACEHLSAKANLKTSKAAAKSSLKLTAKGPTSEASGAPGDCSLTLDGDFNVEACESFDAKLDIKFGAGLKGSSLTLAKTNIPNCGFVIGGTIDVPELKACKDFIGKSNVRLGKKFTGGLTLTSTGEPNCGLTLEGDIDLPDYCTDFTAGANINIHGKAVKYNKWKLGSSAPNPLTGSGKCGFDLTGDVEISACTFVEPQGGIKISGNAVKEIKPPRFDAGTQPENGGISCGIFLDGEWQINACQDVTVASDVIFKILSPPRGEIYGGDPDEEAGSPSNSSGSGEYGCVSGVGNWTTASNTSPSGASGIAEKGSYGALSLVSVPGGCGVALSGQIGIQACDSLYVKNKLLNVTTACVNDPLKQIIKKNTIKLKTYSDDTHACGLTLTGELQFDGCSKFLITTDPPTSDAGGASGSSCNTSPQLVFKIKDEIVQTVKLPTIKTTVSPTKKGGPCSLNLFTNYDPNSYKCSGNVEIDFAALLRKSLASSTIKVDGATPTANNCSGCSLTVDVDGKLSFKAADAVDDGGGGGGGGGGGVGSGGVGGGSTCSAAGNFKSIYTKYIYRQPEKPKGCCEDSCGEPWINMCEGILNDFTELHTQLIKNNSTCCVGEGDSNYIDMCLGEINFAKLTSPDYFNLSYASGLDFHSSTGQATAIDSTGLTVSDNSESGCGTSLLIGGKLELDSSDKGYYCAIDTCRGELQFGSKEVLGTRLTYDMDTATLQLKGDYGIQLDSTNSTITLEGSTSDANSYIDGSNALLYLNPGDTSYISVDAKNQQITMTSANDDALSITPTSITIENSKGGEVDISPVEDKKAYFQEVTLCVDGRQKKAYVLMTYPEDV